MYTIFAPYYLHFLCYVHFFPLSLFRVRWVDFVCICIATGFSRLKKLWERQIKLSAVWLIYLIYLLYQFSSVVVSVFFPLLLWLVCFGRAWISVLTPPPLWFFFLVNGGCVCIWNVNKVTMLLLNMFIQRQNVDLWIEITNHRRFYKFKISVKVYKCIHLYTKTH